MGLDLATDPLVTAIAVFAQAAVNAHLATELNADAIKSVFDYPRAFTEGLEDTELPALCVYRSGERRERRGHKRHTVVTLTFDYVAPMRGHNKIRPRWSLLQRVWDELVDAIEAGEDPAVAKGAPVLHTAGVRLLQDDPEPEVRYQYARAGENEYPAFTGAITVRTVEEPDLSGLSDLLAIVVGYRLEGETPTLGEEEQPLVSDAIPLHGDVVDPDDQTDAAIEVP